VAIGEQVQGHAPASPLDAALAVVGTRSALALLYAAFGGAHRFDDLVERAGVSTMIGAARLREFVAAGLMTRRPYRSAQRTRHEYVLTDLGHQSLPVVTALVRFGAAVGQAEVRPDGAG
jgi:DNA-binding HxlR family transcriptional regulator